MTFIIFVHAFKMHTFRRKSFTCVVHYGRGSTPLCHNGLGVLEKVRREDYRSGRGVGSIG